jgi:hypothetical protein
MSGNYKLFLKQLFSPGWGVSDTGLAVPLFKDWGCIASTQLFAGQSFSEKIFSIK